MRRLLCAILGILGVARGVAAENERLPLAVAIEVGRGPGAVPEAFLQDLRQAVELELVQRGCFERIADAPENAALLVRVLVDDVVEETSYDLGIADRSRIKDPNADLAYVCTFDVRCGVELDVVPGRLRVRTKRFRAAVDRRPVVTGQDVAAEARSQAVAQVAREARAVVCKGSRAKLLREIEAVRAQAPSSPPAR